MKVQKTLNVNALYEENHVVGTYGLSFHVSRSRLNHQAVARFFVH